MTRLITAADLCAAMEVVQRAELPGLIEAFNLTEVLKTFETWDQVPTVEALTAASLPAGLVTSPGLAESPVRKGGRIDAVWRVVVGIYDRDHDFTTTAHRTRIWAGLIRAAALRHPSLGGIATGVTWVGERYDTIPGRSAGRTLGGCAVTFNVSARNVADVDDLGPDPLPLVTETHPLLTIERGENA